MPAAGAQHSCAHATSREPARDSASAAALAAGEMMPFQYLAPAGLPGASAMIIGTS